MKKHLTWDEFCDIDDKDAFKIINTLAVERNKTQCKLDAVLRVVKREDITYGAASEIRAIIEGDQP